MQDPKIFPAGEPTSTLLQSQTNPPHRILVVDADPYICHLSAEVLIRHGYEVNAAEDGVTGWKELQTCSYHLLITEHNLPKLTGIELVRKLRAARMALPVVMAAGKLPTRALARNPSLQLAATLVKPFAVGALLTTVKIVLHATDHPPEQTIPQADWQWHPAEGGDSLRPYNAYECWGIND